jgi:hypothetical protein
VPPPDNPDFTALLVELAVDRASSFPAGKSVYFKVDRVKVDGPRDEEVVVLEAAHLPAADTRPLAMLYARSIDLPPRGEYRFRAFWWVVTDLPNREAQMWGASLTLTPGVVREVDGTRSSRRLSVKRRSLRE